MTRTITAPPPRLNHRILLFRTAGIAGVLFALAVGLSWTHQRGWQTGAVAVTALILALAAGQLLGAGRNSAGADLAAALLLAGIVAGATARAVYVGWHSVALEATAFGALALVVACAVYGYEALARLWSAIR